MGTWRKEPWLFPPDEEDVTEKGEDMRRVGLFSSRLGDGRRTPSVVLCEVVPCQRADRARARLSTLRLLASNTGKSETVIHRSHSHAPAEGPLPDLQHVRIKVYLLVVQSHAVLLRSMLQITHRNMCEEEPESESRGPRVVWQ